MRRSELHTAVTSRRSIIGAAAGLAASAVFVARVGAQSSSGSPVAGGFSFTDDNGTTVTLDELPRVIVADVSAAAPLWDFGVRPVAVSGWTAGDGYNSAAWGNIDPDQIQNINAEDNTPDIEKLVEFKPDLFVTITFRPGDLASLWGINQHLLLRMQAIVPIVAIAATGSAAVSTDRFAELAGLLGADLTAPEIVAAKSAYDEQISSFSTLAKEKADLTSLFVYGAADGLSVAKAPDWADLAWYQELGLNIVDPDVAVGEFWEGLSWEQALKYPADIVFNTTRGEAFTNQQLIDHPTFGQHPAIKAGQIGSWNQDFIMSYQGLTAALTEMTKTLSASKKII